MTLYLNLGSNLGDRADILASAVSAIRDSWPQATLRISDPIETPAWGYESPHPFLNIGLALDFPVEPAGLPEWLDGVYTHLEHITARLGGGPHRNPDGTYRDRALDIDIIALDERILTTPRLELPHPRAHLRDFVMIPMLQLAPAWRNPRTP